MKDFELVHENQAGISASAWRTDIMNLTEKLHTQRSFLPPPGGLPPSVQTLLPSPGTRASVAPGVSLSPLTDSGLSFLCSQDFSSCPQRNPCFSLGVQLPITADGQVPRVASWTRRYHTSYLKRHSCKRQQTKVTTSKAITSF